MYPQQIARAGGIYAVAFIFSISAHSAADSWGREIWWCLFLAANGPALWLISRTQC